MPLYNGYSNNYDSYSSCKKVKAMKEYRCEITGKLIHKGEQYYSLRWWNPVKGKHFDFKFSLNVPTRIRNFYRTYPEEAKQELSIHGPVLGFFSEHKQRDFDELEEIMERILERKMRCVILG